MIDHMDFNKRKFYPVDPNATAMTAGGKKWIAVPKSFVIPKGITITGSTQGRQASQAIANENYTVTQVNGAGSDEFYFQADNFPIYNYGNGTILIGSVAKTAVKNVIWGG